MENTKTVTNTAGGYQLTVPTNWNVSMRSSETLMLAIQQGLELDLTPSSAGGFDIDKCYDIYVHQQFPAVYVDYKILAQEKGTIDGYQSRTVIFTYSLDGAQKAIVTFMIRNDIVYLFQGTGSPQSVDAHGQEFRQISSSISFTE